jgi:hypothetical protein
LLLLGDSHSIARAQPCASGPGLFEYGPHYDDAEAEFLAMQISGQKRAPEHIYHRIHRDLILIRAARPYLNTVHLLFPYNMRNMFVRRAGAGPWPDYEALNDYYQVIDDRPLGASRLITFCDTLNIPLIEAEYEALPDVEFATPNSSLGDGDSITVGGVWFTYRYIITEGMGDCLAGCFCYRTWTFDVDVDGYVTVISFNEGCPGSFAACCNFGTCGEFPSNCPGSQGPGTTCVDANSDGLADACDKCPNNPLKTVPDASGCSSPPPLLGRFIPYDPPGLGISSALRVELTSLYHPNPPNNPCCPGPDFSSMEGQYRWVGPPQQIMDMQATYPQSVSYAALQCTPHYTNWDEQLAGGKLYIMGKEIIPSSHYLLEVFPQSGGGPIETLELMTSRWGDINSATLGTPNALDVGMQVDKVKGLSLSLRPVHKLLPALVNPAAAINAAEIGAAADAVKGMAYPYADLTTCP